MVQRRATRGRRTGGFFWGCSRYPACRETADIPDIAATPDPFASVPSDVRDVAQPDVTERLPGGGAVIGVAGGSARRTFERRREAYDAQRPDRLGRALPRAVIAAVVVAVVLSAWGQGLALLFAGMIGVVIVLEAIVPRQTTQAWVTGAEGEELTAEYLEPLAAAGYVILHDRRISMSRANIDHIVIGPTGVFVIETKNIAGDFRVSGDEIRIGRRRVDLVAEVRQEVAATWNAVAPTLAPKGLLVHPVVCAHRANLPIFRRRVAGIRIVSGRGLARYILGEQQVLTIAEIEDLRRRVVVALPAK